jgi:hypothetical protein
MQPEILIFIALSWIKDGNSSLMTASNFDVMFVESEIAKLQVSVPGHAVMFAIEFAPGAANPWASNTE